MHVSCLFCDAELFCGAGRHVAQTTSASPATDVPTSSPLAAASATATKASLNPAAAACVAAANEASSTSHSHRLHDSPGWQATLQSLFSLAGHVLVPAGFLVTWLPYSANPSYHVWLRNQGAQQGLQLQSLLAEQRRSGVARGVVVFQKGGLPAGAQEPRLESTPAGAQSESACTCCATSTPSQGSLLPDGLNGKHTSTAEQVSDQSSAALTSSLLPCTSQLGGAKPMAGPPTQPGQSATASTAISRLWGTAPVAEPGLLEAAPVAQSVPPATDTGAPPRARASIPPEQLVHCRDSSAAASQLRSASSTSRANQRHTSIDACR